MYKACTRLHECKCAQEHNAVLCGKCLCKDANQAESSCNSEHLTLPVAAFLRCRRRQAAMRPALPTPPLHAKRDQHSTCNTACKACSTEHAKHSTFNTAKDFEVLVYTSAFCAHNITMEGSGRPVKSCSFSSLMQLAPGG